ncbi:MAG: hypothetical protein ACUVUG_06745 [Candidatus Aminicenantia bacterium]
MIEAKFTKEQFKSLLKLISTATWVINAFRKEPLKEFEELEQYIYSIGKKSGFSNMIDYDEDSEIFLPSDNFEDEVMDYIDNYNEEIFWQILITRLTMRDMVRELGENAFEKLDNEQKTNRMIPIFEKYASEFSKNGIENLEVKRIIY